MEQDSLAQLDELFVSALRELMEAHDLAVKLDPIPAGRHADREVACSIGFMSAILRGVLLLAVNRAVLRATHPAGHGEELDRAALADWAGELSNELLGRIKNKLLRRGLTIALSVPSVVTGSGLNHAVARLPVALSHEFDVTLGYGYVSLEAELEGPLELQPESESPGGISEGEIQLL